VQCWCRRTAQPVDWSDLAAERVPSCGIGFSRYSTGPTPARLGDLDEIQELLDAGAPRWEIAMRLGVSRTAIHKRVTRLRDRAS
jgi:hypothetical protein